MADPDPNAPPATGGGAPPKPDPPKPDPPKSDPPPAKGDDEPLGEGGKRALEAEREQRKAEKRRADDAEAELKKLRDAQLSKEQRLEQDAAEGKKIAAEGRKALRNANLLVALTNKGLGNVTAAARLLDGVKYDDEQKPTNLDDAIAAAKVEFGDAMFEQTRRPAANVNSGNGAGGSEGGDGPKLTAAEKEAASRSNMTDEEYAWYRDNPQGGMYQPPEGAKT